MLINCLWPICPQSCYVINVCTHRQIHIWMKTLKSLINTHICTKSRFCHDLIWYNLVPNHQWVAVIIQHSIRNTHSSQTVSGRQIDALCLIISAVCCSFPSSFHFEFHPLSGFVHKSVQCQITDKKTCLSSQCEVLRQRKEGRQRNRSAARKTQETSSYWCCAENVGK